MMGGNQMMRYYHHVPYVGNVQQGFSRYLALDGDDRVVEEKKIDNNEEEQRLVERLTEHGRIEIIC
jgi:hypothetical protein